MRDRNGDVVTAMDVLSDDELADYYRGRPWPSTTGWERLNLGAAVEEHIEKGEN